MNSRMCGIAGIFEFSAAAPNSDLLAAMTRLLAHRGPDGSGHVVIDNVALGHRRLSIIDLSANGHQPMSDEDSSCWIVYNGECYNYRRLRERLLSLGYRFKSQSDTEVILHLYRERGEAFLQDIEGMFALAIWDRKRHKLIIARDRVGMKPLFYHRGHERLLFASEMKALLADASVPTSVNIDALGDYLHLLSITDAHSIFSGIRKLRPGCYLRISPAGVEEKQYWNLEIRLDPKMGFESAVREFDKRFAQTVASHMVADVPVGAFLSGGVDSSSIVSRAIRFTNRPIETFSISFPGLDEFDESPYAGLVASHCGAQHHEFNLTPDLIDSLPKIVWHADEPFAISSAFALYHLSKLARKHVKVVLSGDGGDELFAGYVWRHVDFPKLLSAADVVLSRLFGIITENPTLYSFLPLWLRARLRRWKARDQRYLQSFVAFQDADLEQILEPHLWRSVRQTWRENEVQRCLDEAQTSEQLAQKLYADVKTTLVSEMLTKVDRMTMAHGLEARVPFLDHHLVEWSFTVPGVHKLSNGSGKRLIKEAMAGDLPPAILHRVKQGFNVPMKHWMKSELRDFVRDNLTASQIRRRGHFSPQAVEVIIDEHFSGKRDASNKIFAMLMLELWYQKFVDQRASIAVH
jgi:asparagine synthase (glutamine-hydrolysing)